MYSLLPDAMAPPVVTVLIPCLNEAQTLAACIYAAHTGLRKGQLAGEVVVADNGSSDGSGEIAIAAGARVVSIPSRGYGNALLGGIAEARGKYIVMADADGSYDLGETPRFVEKLSEGYSLVMGNRFTGEIKPGAMPLHHRYIGNPILSTIGRLLFQVDCGDFHCGMRAFDRDAIRSLHLQSAGMEFASEMVAKAALHKLAISELPVTLYPDGRNGPSHLRSVPDGIRHLQVMCALYVFGGRKIKQRLKSSVQEISPCLRRE